MQSKTDFIILTLIGILTSISYFFGVGLFGNNLDIIVLDIGQGDAMFFRTPDKETILVDTGVEESIDSKLRNYIPFWNKELDYLVITHLDIDHMGQTHKLLENWNVQNLVIEDFEKDGWYIDQIEKIVAEKNINIIYVDPNNELEVGAGCCVTLKFYPKPGPDLQLSENDQSLIMQLEYNDFQYLAMGDVSKEIELAAQEKYNFSPEIFKISHHGSNTSTSLKFLAKLSPELVILNYGQDNKFGHPHPEVMQTITDLGIDYVVTGGCGNTKISVSEDSYTTEKNCLVKH